MEDSSRRCLFFFEYSVIFCNFYVLIYEYRILVFEYHILILLHTAVAKLRISLYNRPVSNGIHLKIFARLSDDYARLLVVILINMKEREK